MKHPPLRLVEGWSNLGPLEEEKPTSCYLAAVAYMSRHRTAYYGRSSDLYSRSDAFDYDVRSLQKRARRSNGTTWYVQEIPGIVINGSNDTALAIVEINTQEPFAEIKPTRTPLRSLADAARRFRPERPNSIFRFQTSIGAVAPAQLPLITTWSTRRNGAAAWNGEAYDIDIAHCARLVARLNVLLHRHPVDHSDIYRVIQQCQ